jgi:hypothetical protein
VPAGIQGGHDPGPGGREEEPESADQGRVPGWCGPRRRSWRGWWQGCERLCQRRHLIRSGPVIEPMSPDESIRFEVLGDQPLVGVRAAPFGTDQEEVRPRWAYKAGGIPTRNSSIGPAGASGAEGKGRATFGARRTTLLDLVRRESEDTTTRRAPHPWLRGVADRLQTSAARAAVDRSHARTPRARGACHTIRRQRPARMSLIVDTPKVYTRLPWPQ